MAHYFYLVNGFGIGKDFFWIYMFGRVSRMNIQNRARWKYHYTIADHLGNARVEFVQSVSYYPFGYTLHCNDYGSRQPNRHLFGGKELQDQTLAGITFGWYDFEARMYDPAIGRFMQTDPMAEKYYWISPHAYCANNPIKFVDPTGMIIDPSELTKEQQEEFRQAMELTCVSSELFKTMYDAMDKSEIVYRIRIGETNGDVPGQYNSCDNSITFKSAEDMVSADTYMEELFHGYQWGGGRINRFMNQGKNSIMNSRQKLRNS